MAGVTKKDIPEVSDFMGEFWNLMKKYWIPEKDNDFWDELFSDIESLNRKYDTKLCSMLLATFVEWLDMKYRGKVDG